MESTLLPDMLRGGINPLEKYLARETSDQEELRTLILASDFIANVLDLVRKNVDRYIKDGMEGRQLISLLKDILVATEAAPRAIALVRERVVAEPDYAGRQEDLLAINLDHERAEKFRKDLESICQRIHVPFPTVDAAWIAELENRANTGPFTSSEQILANLRAGEPS